MWRQALPTMNQGKNKDQKHISDHEVLCSCQRKDGLIRMWLDYQYTIRSTLASISCGNTISIEILASVLVMVY